MGAWCSKIEVDDGRVLAPPPSQPLKRTSPSTSPFPPGSPLPKFKSSPLRPKTPSAVPVPLPPPPPPLESEPHPRIEDRETTPPKNRRGPRSPSSGLRAFSYEELAAGTNNFHATHVLGEGGFGKVYKGFLATSVGDKTLVPVAVKKLNQSGFQGHQEWLREISVLGKVAHPNLVLLLGYCDQRSERMLVYEFLPLGSLDYHLFTDPGKVRPLSWQRRVKIAIHAAMGLAHLHKRNIIHRDFKASNILLDEKFAAKLTDFGMAKDGPQLGHTHVSTAIMGTLGYLDPRYAETGRLTQKSDVYAFGVVLLELLSGRRAMTAAPNGQPLPMTVWARPYLSGRAREYLELVDPDLRETFPEQAVKTFMKAARQCVHEDPKFRPDMEDLVFLLSDLEDLIVDWRP